MKLLSHFVFPGAHRIETLGGKDHLAFINPDNHIVLLLVNTDLNDKIVKIRLDDKWIRVSIKGKSINSLVWQPSKIKHNNDKLLINK
jgi:glucosylceramidase